MTQEQVAKAFAKLDVKFDDLKIERRQLLESLGWNYTSDTIGSIWMFKKTICDVTYMVDADTAATFEIDGY